MNRTSVLAMGAAIALTAGLVVALGLTETNGRPRTVPAVDALEPDPLIATTGSSEETGVDYAEHDSLEILGLGSDTTTTLATTTTTPSSQPSSAPPTTVRARSTTSTVPPTTTPSSGEYRSDLEAQFLAEINAYRAANGLPALQRESSLDTRARNWSKRMADSDRLSHSNLSDLLPPWSAAGENVGRGGSVTGLMNALIESAGHRANLLGNFTHVGLGVWVSSNGTIWVTQVFVR